MFDRVVFINLKRRPDRLAAFRLAQAEKGWRLPEPELFQAIDGDKVGVPEYYLAGGGAWGCARSHVSILERAILDDVGSLLVLEDDLTWMSDAWERLDRFMAEVPKDWELLMLGGQHIRQPGKVSPGIEKCINAQRTHAYAVRGRAIKDLLRLWYRCNTHIDHWLGPWQASRKVYCPTPFIFGQSSGHSDISGADNPVKFWTEPDTSLPVVHITAPAPVVAKLRGYGLHTGHDRDPATDFDRGIVEVASSPYPVDTLRRWLQVILWEVASEEGSVACVWHPDVSAETVRRAHTGPVIEVRGDTVEECRAQLPPTLKLRASYATSHVVILRAERQVMEALRGIGWHSGNWRDDVTGQDNGLRRIATQTSKRAEKLAEWVAEVGAEAEGMTGGVPTIWHPEIGLDEVRAAVPERTVIEVQAGTVEDAVRAFRGAA